MLFHCSCPISTAGEFSPVSPADRAFTYFFGVALFCVRPAVRDGRDCGGCYSWCLRGLAIGEQTIPAVVLTRQGQPLSRHNLLRRQLRPVCNKLGLHGITWHSLRHSHATMLDAVGASLGTVQALLGHSAAEITREVYVHAIPDDQRRAVNALESLVFGFNRTQPDSTLSSSKNGDAVSN